MTSQLLSLSTSNFLLRLHLLFYSKILKSARQDGKYRFRLIGTDSVFTHQFPLHLKVPMNFQKVQAKVKFRLSISHDELSNLRQIPSAI